MRKPAAVLLVLSFAVLALALVPAAGLAAKGAGGANRTSASLAFDPAQAVVVGSQYWVTGSGLSPNTWIVISAQQDTTYWGSGWSDDQGNVRLGPFTATVAGDSLHQAWEMNLRNGRTRLVGNATLTVSAVD